jgi:hypothetical protein
MLGFTSSNRGGMLPSGGLGKKDNGVSFSTVNKSVLATVGWSFISLLLIYMGYLHCSYNFYEYKFECSKDICTYTTTTYDLQTSLDISRSALRACDPVRINATGHIIPKNTRVAGRNGYSLNLIYSQKPETEVGGHKMSVERSLLISPKDMKRKYSRNMNSAMQKYLIKQTDKVKINVRSTVTVIGVLICFLGFLSLLFSCVFGAWADPKRRRSGARKSS